MNNPIPNSIPDQNSMLIVCHVLRENPLTRDDDPEMLRECWLRQKPVSASSINSLVDLIKLGEIKLAKGDIMTASLASAATCASVPSPLLRVMRPVPMSLLFSDSRCFSWRRVSLPQIGHVDAILTSMTENL